MVLITRTLSKISVVYGITQKTCSNVRKLISLGVARVVFNTPVSPTNPVPKPFFSSCTGILLNTGSTFKLLRFSVAYFTFPTACVFTFPRVLSHSCSFPKILQYQSAHRSIHTHSIGRS